MSEELQQKLRTQLWTVANTLRGNMSASDFMYFTLGFIFYKYLSEKIEMCIDAELEEDGSNFKEAWASNEEELKEELKKFCMNELGYFIEPEYLYSSVIEAINRKENILPQLERSLKKIEDSTIGHDSEEDFGGLFSDIDLASPKLGKTAEDKNNLISEVLIALDGIDFGLNEASDIDILGDAYEYMIGQFAAGAGKKAGEFYTPQEVSQILADIVTTGKTRLKMACVAPHGVLFRGASEGKIRRFLIEKKNYIDAIIGLPANIFYGTSIPTCIIVVKKCRKDDDNILFIDASKEFEKIKTQNKLRPEHIKKIVDTYRERKEIEKYSHLATLQEVADNDYNLNIPRYVDTFEEEEPIDIHAVMKEIKDLEAKRADLDKQIDVYLKELGLVE